MTRRILERVPGFGAIAPTAAAHHERLDGSGYPDGLTGAELTAPMRLLAVADVYEALTSERPYRGALSSEHALRIIRAEAPHALDRAAADALAGLAHDPAAPAGLAARGHPAETAARVEEVLDRPR
jgi:HD-GYP domain-containing protein (c-di-GMP phosphodiesterase class II)